MDDAIAGGGEQTLTVHIFGISEHLRDASVMYNDNGCVRARRDCCLSVERARLRIKRRKKIEPIANYVRHDGSQGGSQAKMIDKFQRR